MRSVTKWTVAGLLVAVAGALAGPAAAEEKAAGFYVADQLRVGSVDLAPAPYMVRVVAAGPSRDVLLVTDIEGTKVFAALLATPHQIAAPEIAPTSRLLYTAKDGSHPNTLRTFLVANSSFGYDILSSGAETKMASARTGSIDAIATIQ